MRWSIRFSISSIVRNHSLPYAGEWSRWLVEELFILGSFQQQGELGTAALGRDFRGATQNPFALFAGWRYPLGRIDVD